MKGLIRSLVFYTVSIYLISLLVPGFKLNLNLYGLLICGAVLAFLFIFINPFFKFLLLPINILTMGLFSFFSQVLTFFVFLKLFPKQIIIESWNLSSWSYSPLGLNIDSLIVSPFVTILIATVLISLIVSILSILL
jgi:uncharacterized membrane protein YvlD (DUF360 family)